MRTALLAGFATIAAFGALTSIHGQTAAKQSVPADGDKPWAFRVPLRPAIPAVADKSWVRNPIDAFILSKMEKAGLAPAKEADRATLIRRLSFDLTGLPPTPDEVVAFIKDSAADAYEKLVDRLLASPRYGE